MDDLATLRRFYAARDKKHLETSRARRRQFENMLPELVRGILEIDPETELVILFGSLTRPEADDVRDIDLAIRCRRFYRVAAWLLRQEEPIDVSDLDDLYPHIRNRVLKEGRVLYEKK